MYISPRRHLVYITDTRKGFASAHFEHLSCFFPATLALGAWSLPDLPPYERELHQMAANALAESCWLVYKDTGSGLGPEVAFFEPFVLRDMESGRFIKHYEKWVKNGRKGRGPLGLDRLPDPVNPKNFTSKDRDYYLYSAEYKLRPEVRNHLPLNVWTTHTLVLQTVETMYLMWKTTGNVVWRERAWEIFQRLEQWTRIPTGYAALTNVDKPLEGGFKDNMPRCVKSRSST